MKPQILLALALVTGPVVRSNAQHDHASHGSAQAAAAVPLHDNLGSHSFAISTTDPRVQAYFDQGLRLYYAFNHDEAIRAFREAARLEPGCAMCWWGIGLAYGPNINLPQDSASAVAAWDATREAVARRENSSGRERALIDGLAGRYEAVPPADRSHLDRAWADALRDVVAQHPADLEAATLLAEALMDLSPWSYWQADGSPGPHTGELLEHLERVLRANPNHPGANHLYIHAVEAVDPNRAVEQAERLAGLMPGAGHIVHMPGHIYVRVGRYRDAILANEHAVHADETFIQDHNPAQGVYVGGYYPHNYDFLAFAASMIGREEQSVGAAEKLRTLAPVELIHVPGMTFLQAHRTRHLQLKVRFGLWQEILSVPEPEAGLLHERAIWHYGRGRALDALGRTGEAAIESGRLDAIATNPEVAGLRLEFNSSAAILGIASAVLKAKIAHTAGDIRSAAGHLGEAARLEDALTYGEPPEWTVPVRQEAGRMLLSGGRPAEAERVFLEDLERFPANGWSLFGLSEALASQGRNGEADAVRGRFQAMWEGEALPW
jgi:tetratricopeptide (TPR) repeat protein